MENQCEAHYVDVPTLGTAKHFPNNTIYTSESFSFASACTKHRSQMVDAAKASWQVCVCSVSKISENDNIILLREICQRSHLIRHGIDSRRIEREINRTERLKIEGIEWHGKCMRNCCS